MAAATSFANLLSPNILTITDGSVTVGGGVNRTVTFNSNGGTGSISVTADHQRPDGPEDQHLRQGGLLVQRLGHP